MKSSTVRFAFTLAGALLVLTGASCVATRREAAPAAPTPRDLTPVTWMKSPAHAPVEIVRDGKPRAVVYVADPRGREVFDPRDFRYANSPFPPALPRLVHELLEVIRLGSGAALECVTNAPPANRPAIVIGDCEETRKAGIDAARIPPEGFVVRTAPNRVYLVGSTMAMPPGGSGANNGTAWAVADFLERLVGVRWYWPAEYGGRSIPRCASLAIPPAHYRDQPVFRQRTFHPEQIVLLPLSFAPHYSTPGELMSIPVPFAPGVLPEGEPYVTLVPHLPLMRYGFSLPYQPVMQGARASDLAAAAAQLKPRVEAMFALRKDGSRNYGVLCYSAPETLAWLLNQCAQAWDQGRPAGSWITPSGVNLWFPFTPGLACDCPACRGLAANYRDDRELNASLAAQHGDRRVFEIVEALVHERVFGLFVKRMCEAVKPRWPDKKVVVHPWHTDCPRDMEFPDNLVVAHLDSGFRMGLMHQPVVRRAQEERVRAWSRSIRGGGAVVGWWCGFYGPSDWTYGPAQFPHTVQDFYRANRDVIAGSQVATYSLPCWTTAAPTWYVWMRVLWNPELDVDAVLDDMCRRLFGAGADAARALLRLECERWEGMTWSRPLLQESMRAVGEGSLRFPDDYHFKESWPPDVVARMKALHDQALAQTADDPHARQALLFWTWTFDEFVKYAASIYGNAALVMTDEAPPAPGTNVVRGVGGPGSTPAAVPPVTKTNATDGAVMVLIPAGEFLMGTTEAERTAWLAAHPDTSRSDLIKFTAIEESSSFGEFWRGAGDAQRAAWLQERGVRRDNPVLFRDEMPSRQVHLDAYYMYKTEVTVAQYRKFCQATGRVPPPEPRRSGSGSRDAGKDRESHPVVNVSWEDARAYADWAGAALPTEAEWEKAARGGDRRVFPWGDAWPPPPGSGNVADESFGAIRLRSRYFLDTCKDGFAYAAPAGSFAVNPYGLHDLAGNVAEWCADWYDANGYRKAPGRNPAGPATGVWRVVRGGSWQDGTPWTFRAARRGDYDHLPVGSSSFAVGFRCVVRVPPE